jgi:hypothetical protein
MEFTNIFDQIDSLQHVINKPKRLPGISEVWQEVRPGLFRCKYSGRELSRTDFLIYQNLSDCGPLGFLTEVL